MNAALRVTLRAMLDELESSRLHVEVIPAPSPRHEGHGVRAVFEQNAAWYRRFCASFLSSRRRPSAKVDTAIRRRETVRALRRLLDKGAAGPVYGPRLIDAARAYWKRHAADLRARMESETVTA